MPPIAGDLDTEVYEGTPFATAEWRASAWATFSLLLRGSVTDGEAVFLPGVVSYRPAGSDERLTFGANGCTLLRIAVAPDRLAPFDLTHPQRARIANYVTASERVRRELGRTDAAAPLALRSAALHIVGLAMRQFQGSTFPLLLTVAREVIAARFRERIRPSDVAASVGVTPTRLARAFRQELGASVTSAIRAARVEAAIRELRESDASTAAIAAHCGFYDASHLIRAMEATQGLTPSDLREGGGS